MKCSLYISSENTMSKENCWLCQSLVDYGELSWIFIPGERYVWPDFMGGGIVVKASIGYTNHGSFKLCRECLELKGHTNEIRKKLGLKHN